MGANCCVAAKEEKPLPDDAQVGVSTHRNVRHSPSWSFRCDNRTHIEDMVDGFTHLSHPRGRGVGPEIKSGAERENGGISNGNSLPGSRLNAARNTKGGSAGGLSSFRIEDEDSTNVNLNPSLEKFIGSKMSLEENIKSLGIASALDVKPSTCISVPSASASNLDPASSSSLSLSCDPTSSRQARSLGSQLSRQGLDSRVPYLKSLTENSSPEGLLSSVNSISGNDSSIGGSQGGSPDGWSTRTFTELVVSSQRERWSFDSENLSSIKSTFVRSNTRPSDSPTCAICSKLIKERSPWSPQMIVSISDLSVVAVLVCGHVYHAECLENMTRETDRFEPPCPICTNDEKSAWRLSRKAELKARSKVSRTAVADADVYVDPVSGCRKPEGKGPKIGASSSMKNALSRPFTRRHFSSIESRPMQSVSENGSTSNKGFWAKYRRD